jgi:hypothetical protein
MFVFEHDTDRPASPHLYEEDGDHFMLVERNPPGREDTKSSCSQDGGNLNVFAAKSTFCGEEAPQRSRKFSSHWQPLSSTQLSSLPSDTSYALTAYLEDNNKSHLDHGLKYVQWHERPKVYGENGAHDGKVGDSADVLMVGAWIKGQGRSAKDEHDSRSIVAETF